MILGIDNLGVVRLVSNKTIPKDWNGFTLTPLELDKKQEQDYFNLDPERSGTIFNEKTGFTAIPKIIVPDPVPTSRNPAILAVLADPTISETLKAAINVLALKG